MNKSESIKELATALSKAQANFKPVPLNAINPFLKNHYADLGSVIESSKVTLSVNGLSIAQLTTSEQGWIGVTTILMHQSGEWLESTMTLPLSEEKGKSMAQVAGSMITYIRRYAYGAMIGLYTGDDDDGNAKAEGSKTVATKHPDQGIDPAERDVNQAEDYCLIHNCTMKQFTKDDRSWYSHKLDNGDWCNGKEVRKPKTKAA